MGDERVLSITSDHPSLAGHFPSHPVVPGVVLLDEVLDLLRQSLPGPLVVTGLPMVKFVSPLKPGEMVTIRVDEETPARATFSCRAEARLVASGAIEFTHSPRTHAKSG
jgi:3-hydroxyacyl-[acyl-carrier-protein] dehydratase